MKKLLTIILAISIIASFTACGKKQYDETENVGNEIITDNEADPTEEPTEAPTEKPTDKPTEKPTNKPTDKPISDPTAPPTEKPTEAPTEAPNTLGKSLLADFKAKAGSKSALEIAELLLQNPGIKFSGVTQEVAEGLLPGFGNTEIKGFKSGATFVPMIGSIAFVGYIFELENPADASAFVKNLEANANPRWNVCVEAEETVTGVSGNKVFFVMCPTVIED